MEITQDTLSAVITQAKAGKQSAFNFLLTTFWGQVYGFQLKRTQNAYEAEDITIQTFSKAFDKIASYKSEYKFATWLITISKNIHIDSLRKRNSSIKTDSSKIADDKAYEMADENLGPEDALIREQNLAGLLRDIKLLKPHYQEIINLRYFQEMSYKEMAEELNEPMTNVKVKLLRARRLLSDIIHKTEE